MDLASIVAVDLVRQVVPNFKDGILLDDRDGECAVWLTIEDALMQEIVHFLFGVVDVILDENGAFGVPADQVQVLEYLFGHHLVQGLQKIGLLVGAQQLSRQVHFLNDVDQVYFL